MKYKARFSTNTSIFLLFAVGWILMFIQGEDFLSSPGFENLKYFTVLSNLFEGLTCLLWSVAYLVTGKTYRWIEILKYIAATSVFLTFTVVLVFLGPAYGFSLMYRNANLFFHLLVPLFAFMEAVLLVDENFSMKINFFVMIPPFVYGLYYVVNIIVNGIGAWPDTNDFYGFLTWGPFVGVVIFLSILGLSFVLGLAIRLLRKNVAEGFRFERKKKKRNSADDESAVSDK